jgi:outer membrane protein
VERIAAGGSAISITVSMSSARPTLALAALAGLSVLLMPGAVRASTLTLPEAVSRALARGPDAIIARLESERADETVSLTRGSYYPALSITSRAGYSNRQDEKLRAVDSNGVQRTYGLATLASDRGWLNVFVRQLLLDLRTWRDIERSEIEAEAAATAEKEQREAVAFAVIDRYVNVLQVERLVGLDQERLDGAQWLDEQAGILLNAGRSLPTEREHASIHLEEVRMGLDLRREELQRARKMLWLLIGIDEAEAEMLELDEDSVPEPSASSELMAADATEVLASTPELRILDLRQQADEKAVAAARANRYPTLALNAGYLNYGTKRFDNFTDEFVVGIDFEVNLFDGFRTRHQIEGASKDAEIARLRYQNMLDEKRVRVRDLMERLQRTEKQPELARRRAKMSRNRMQLANLNLKAQRGTLEEALAVQFGYGRDAAGAIRTEFDRVLTWATLLREIGKLTDRVTGGAKAGTSP